MNNKQWICEKCNHIFASKRNLERHNNNKFQCNADQSVFCCEKCNKQFTSKDGLTKHNNKKIPCSSNSSAASNDTIIKASQKKQPDNFIISSDHKLTQDDIIKIKREIKQEMMQELGIPIDVDELIDGRSDCDTYSTYSGSCTSDKPPLHPMLRKKRYASSVASTAASTISSQPNTNTRTNTRTKNHTQNQTNNINNTVINNNIDNKSINNNLTNVYNLNYIINNCDGVKNIEDCVNYESVTREMINECKTMYFIDGATYLIKKMCDIGVEIRPLHCTDSSRNCYIYRTNNLWKVDAGGEEIHAKIYPVIEQVYDLVHNERIAEHPNMLKYIRDKIIDMNSINVKRISTRALRNAKSCFLAKNINVTIPEQQLAQIDA